jgi:uncharacterized protein YndB with AHSA1/START domain
MDSDGSADREIDAPPEVVWAMVSDLGRMGEWSPENVGGEWIGQADGPEPGARFRGRNRNGWRRWSTVATVIDAEPGRRFSFRVTSLGLDVADWAYDLEPTARGCRVTQSWSDLRPGWFKPIARMATGVADRQSHNLAGAEATLEALATAATASTEG